MERFKINARAYFECDLTDKTIVVSVDGKRFMISPKKRDELIAYLQASRDEINKLGRQEQLLLEINLN